MHSPATTLTLDDGPPDPKKGLNPKVVEVYTKSALLSESNSS